MLHFPEASDYHSQLDAVPLAQRTKSDQFHGELVPRIDFDHWLTEAIGALQQLDRIKKTLFYGRPYALRTNIGHADAFKNCDPLPDGWGDKNSGALTTQQAVDLIHGALGKATEAAELLELLRDTIDNPHMFNPVDWREETFDSRWYDYACIMPALGVTPEALDYAGFCKLRARFADKFTEDAANTRDLKAEAVAFTGNAAAAPLGTESDERGRQWIGGNGGNGGNGMRAVYTPPVVRVPGDKLFVSRNNAYRHEKEDGTSVAGFITWEPIKST